jgi:hypothetical protein
LRIGCKAWGEYLTDALRIGMLGDFMVVELLGLAVKNLNVASNIPEEALVDVLKVALGNKVVVGICLEGGRIKGFIQLV